MVARRYHIQHRLTIALILIGLFLPAAPFVAGNEQKPSESEERLRELLTERYDVLKNRLAFMEIFVENGRIDPAEWRSAIVALHHAEAELCTTDAGRVKVYERLVEAMQTQQDLAARREAAGRIGPWQLAEARIATIEAQIDLERARLGR